MWTVTPLLFSTGNCSPPCHTGQSHVSDSSPRDSLSLDVLPLFSLSRKFLKQEGKQLKIGSGNP